MIEKNKKMYVAFVDLEKAYDTMSRKKLWRVLEGYITSATGIKALYEGSQACVRVESRVSQWFEIRQGVRQGCVLSPVLFNILMDKVMREAMESWRGGVQMLNTQTKGLLFADDVAVTAEKEEDLQQNLEALDRSLRKWNLRMNVNKTKVMEVSGTGGGCEMRVQGKQVEEVKAKKYLGVMMSDDGSMDAEVEHRICMQPG